MDLFTKLREMKMLLVEDDKWIRDSLRLFFQGEGCHLSTFESAEEGLAVLEDETYDIIMSDYRLPGMDGLAFLDRIQASHPEARTILMTAYGNEKIFSEAKRIGVNAFIEKPFTSDVVEESLRRIMDPQEKQKTSHALEAQTGNKSGRDMRSDQRG